MIGRVGAVRHLAGRKGLILPRLVPLTLVFKGLLVSIVDFGTKLKDIGVETWVLDIAPNLTQHDFTKGLKKGLLKSYVHLPRPGLYSS